MKPIPGLHDNATLDGHKTHPLTGAGNKVAVSTQMVSTFVYSKSHWNTCTVARRKASFANRLAELDSQLLGGQVQVQLLPRRWLPYYRRPAQIVFSGSVIGLIACSRTLTVTPTTTEYEPGLRSASESQEGADFGADNSVQLFEAFGGLANEEAAEVDAPSAPLGDFQAQSAGNARD
ncbi:hypothetical protein CPB83DRAFT_840254 [Crepidotus variabilis]|uniref:Uncharacterized protein n=1 Tax=Crepidotus variabilis TaxID=179855 RepID=A0A9P6E5A9_9AGAR|nr:hypothetical protein CPB83DRAFT_840254 [Crepidotus variabilis]